MLLVAKQTFKQKIDQGTLEHVIRYALHPPFGLIVPGLGCE